MDPLNLPGLGARFDHAAVASERIRDLLPVYADVLGGTLFVGGDNPRVGYRALQLAYSDGTRIELMEPLAGSTFFDRFFASGGSRLHHVTFKVADIGAAIAAMRASGYTPTGIFLDTDEWQEVFFHPKESNGVLVQLAQPGPGYPRPLEGAGIPDILAGRGPGQNGVPSP